MAQNNSMQADNAPVKGENSWKCCGIPDPADQQDDFWTRWARAKDSRKCPCGEMVAGGPCPVCGREYEPQQDA